MIMTPANEEILVDPSASRAFCKETLATSRDCSNASSSAGRLVRICVEVSNRNSCARWSPYICFVYGHRPTSTDRCESICSEAKPECSPPLFFVGPVFGWRQTLFHLETSKVEPVQSHHDGETRSSTSGHPSSREVGHLELQHGQNVPCLDVLNRNDGFTVTSHLISFDVLSRSSIEVILKVVVFVDDGSS